MGSAVESGEGKKVRLGLTRMSDLNKGRSRISVGFQTEEGKKDWLIRSLFNPETDFIQKTPFLSKESGLDSFCRFTHVWKSFHIVSFS